MNRARHLPAPDSAGTQLTKRSYYARSVVLLSAGIATALLVPVSAANARGGDWHPVTDLPQVVLRRRQRCHPRPEHQRTGSRHLLPERRCEVPQRWPLQLQRQPDRGRPTGRATNLQHHRADRLRGAPEHRYRNPHHHAEPRHRRLRPTRARLSDRRAGSARVSQIPVARPCSLTTSTCSDVEWDGQIVSGGAPWCYRQ